MAKITKNKFKKAAENTGAILSTIAKKLKVERNTVYLFIRKNPDFCKEILHQEEEKILDMAESQLFRNIKDNERWSINYLLSTKGKKRGYVQRTEESINVNVSSADAIADRVVDKIIDVDSREVKEKKEIGYDDSEVKQ